MRKKRIPTIFGILILIIGVVIGVVFIDQDTGFLPRATPEFLPRSVKITNITSNGFTISWLTQEPATGIVKLGNTTSLDITIEDDRDQLSGQTGSFRTHYVTIKGLLPNTKYYFKIESQGTIYDAQGQPFSISTAPQISSNSETLTMYGTVLTPAQTPAEGAIVYISIPGGTPLSAFVKQNGQWTAAISDVRTYDFAQYFNPLDYTYADIRIEDGANQPTNIRLDINDSQPTPDLVIGQEQDYYLPSDTQVSDGSPSDQNSVPAESKFSLVDIVPTDPDASDPITIQTIPQDDMTFNDLALISGTAPSQARLTISLHSDPVMTASVTAATDGSWQWQPPSQISQGEHTFQITYIDDQQQVHTVQRSFIIASATADAVAYAATPSATPITPTQVPTVIPSQIPTPTIMPVIPASPSAIPVAGHTTNTVIILAIGAIAIISGTMIKKIGSTYEHR